MARTQRAAPENSLYLLGDVRGWDERRKVVPDDFGRCLAVRFACGILRRGEGTAGMHTEEERTFRYSEKTPGARVTGPRRVATTGRPHHAPRAYARAENDALMIVKCCAVSGDE